ncbi:MULTISPECIES: hypothetical protein [Kitasatospora]|uniref:hypothetical protein n=1 Tax=Kitasatospora TaxID=2063 RepID=UPI000C7076C8|nr:hypothetical protein [Kitasatospora sp. GP30]MDH6138127.1 hypothetical protein [Kitasatospora sp. GP30]
MARIRMARTIAALAAAPLAAGLLLAGAGASFADDGAGSSGNSNAGVVSSVGSGNIFGGVDGNANSTQQVATGSGASNQNNTLGVKGNSGVVSTDQGNRNVDITFAPINPQ